MNDHSRCTACGCQPAKQPPRPIILDWPAGWWSRDSGVRVKQVGRYRVVATERPDGMDFQPVKVNGRRRRVYYATVLNAFDRFELLSIHGSARGAYVACERHAKAVQDAIEAPATA